MPRRVGRPGLIGTAARTAVIAGTATAVSGRVANRQARKAQEQYAQQMPQQAAPAPQPAPPPAPAAGGEDVVEKLKELASLKTAGVISEAEFEAAKAKLLNG